MDCEALIAIFKVMAGDKQMMLLSSSVQIAVINSWPPATLLHAGDGMWPLRTAVDDQKRQFEELKA